MAVTTQYPRILIPAGVPGVGAAVAVYVHERRRCGRLACRMAGRQLTQTPNELFAATMDGKIFRSVDGGMRWNESR